MSGTAYILFDDIPLDSFGEHGPPTPQITPDMVIEAAMIALSEGKERTARQFIRAMVDCMEPTSKAAARRVTDDIMEVLKAA